jgi:UDP-glucose 4-epimerase
MLPSSTNIKSILITGAAGGVGHRLCHVLRERGLQVRGLVRPEDDTRRLELSAEDLHVGYVQDQQTLSRALDGIDAVIHCAGLLPDALSSAPLEAFQKVNVEGTRNVMRQAIAHRTKWVIAMSTISVVDHVTRTITPTEFFDYVPDSTDPYLASKIEAEKLLLAMRPDFSGQLAILRLAYVYGPGNYAVWRRPLELLEQGKLKLIGGGAAPFPRIYADDIGRFILTLFEGNSPGGYDGVHVLANPQPTTLRSVFDFVADSLDESRPGSVPLWATRLAANVVGVLPRPWRRGRLEMLTHARVVQFSRGYDLSGVLDRKLMERVGATDYREGLRHMLSDYVALRTVPRP